MKKRKILAAVIILFLAVAVYLNMNGVELENDGLRIIKTLGETEEKTAEETVKTDGGAEYFEEARIEKQKARDQAITTLKESVKGNDLSQEMRDRAAKSIETISTGAISESRIETLIKAKGFSDCVALINEKGANVIVPAGESGLSASDTTKIKDIVVSETGISPEQIKIIEIK